MLNQCMFVGNLGRDPEYRMTQSGQGVANFSIAVNEPYKDRDGEWQEKVEWVRVVIFGKLAESLQERDSLKKGDQVFVQGKMQTRKWTDQAGVEKYSTEIVVSGFGGMLKKLGKRERSDEDAGEAPEPRQSTGQRSRGQHHDIPDLDDIIPF